MKFQQNQVKEFMLKAGQECPDKVGVPELDICLLRYKLHEEEAVAELKEAFIKDSPEKVLDSICDSLVVVLGTAVACGFSPEQVEAGFAEVMRSNMTKFIDGYRREDGKWIKGPSYTPANLEPIVSGKVAGGKQF